MPVSVCRNTKNSNITEPNTELKKMTEKACNGRRMRENMFIKVSERGKGRVNQIVIVLVSF